MHLCPLVHKWAQLGGLQLVKQPVVGTLEATKFDDSGVFNDRLGLAVKEDLHFVAVSHAKLLACNEAPTAFAVSDEDTVYVCSCGVCEGAQ